MKLIADTETGSFPPASSHKGYTSQCRRTLPLHVNGKTKFPIIEKRSQKFKRKQGDIDGRILIEEREGRHLYIIYYHPKEENQTCLEKKSSKNTVKTS